MIFKYSKTLLALLATVSFSYTLSASNSNMTLIKAIRNCNRTEFNKQINKPNIGLNNGGKNKEFPLIESAKLFLNKSGNETDKKYIFCSLIYQSTTNLNVVGSDGKNALLILAEQDNLEAAKKNNNEEKKESEGNNKENLMIDSLCMNSKIHLTPPLTKNNIVNKQNESIINENKTIQKWRKVSNQLTNIISKDVVSNGDDKKKKKINLFKISKKPKETNSPIFSEVKKFLTKKKLYLNLNIENKEWKTPIQLACEKKYIDVVKILLNQKYVSGKTKIIPIDVRNRNFLIQIRTLCNGSKFPKNKEDKKVTLEILKIMLTFPGVRVQKALLPQGNLKFAKNIQKNMNEDIFKLLLLYAVDLTDTYINWLQTNIKNDKVKKEFDKNQAQFIEDITTQTDEKFWKKKDEKYWEKININHGKTSPLCTAIENNNVAAVKALLGRENIAVNYGGFDKKAEFPIVMAAKNKKILQLLFSRGDINPQKGGMKVLGILLKKIIQAKHKSDIGFFKSALRQLVYLNSLKSYAEKRFNINEEFEGGTLLHYVIENIQGAGDLVKACLSQGASPNILNDASKTPIILALEKEKFTIVEKIVMHKPSEEINNKVNFNVQDENDQTLLMHLSAMGKEHSINKIKILKALKNNKNASKPIDLNMQDEKNKTALHYACEREDYAFIEELLKLEGINILIKDNNGKYPLQYLKKDNTVKNLPKQFLIMIKSIEKDKLGEVKFYDDKYTLLEFVKSKKNKSKNSKNAIGDKVNKNKGKEANKTENNNDSNVIQSMNNNDSNIIKKEEPNKLSNENNLLRKSDDNEEHSTNIKGLNNNNSSVIDNSNNAIVSMATAAIASNNSPDMDDNHDGNQTKKGNTLINSNNNQGDIGTDTNFNEPYKPSNEDNIKVSNTSNNSLGMDDYHDGDQTNKNLNEGNTLINKNNDENGGNNNVIEKEEFNDKESTPNSNKNNNDSNEEFNNNESTLTNSDDNDSDSNIIEEEESNKLNNKDNILTNSDDNDSNITEEEASSDLDKENKTNENNMPNSNDSNNDDGNIDDSELNNDLSNESNIGKKSLVVFAIVGSTMVPVGIFLSKNPSFFPPSKKKNRKEKKKHKKSQMA